MYPPAFTTQSAQTSLSSDASPRKTMFVSGGWLPLIVSIVCFFCLALPPLSSRRIPKGCLHAGSPKGSAGRAAAPPKIESSLLSLFSAPSCYPLGFASRSSRHLRFSFVTVLSRILLFTLSHVFQYSTSFSVRLMESTRRST